MYCKVFRLNTLSILMPWWKRRVKCVLKLVDSSTSVCKRSLCSAFCFGIFQLWYLRFIFSSRDRNFAQSRKGEMRLQGNGTTCWLLSYRMNRCNSRLCGKQGVLVTSNGGCDGGSVVLAAPRALTLCWVGIPNLEPLGAGVRAHIMVRPLILGATPRSYSARSNILYNLQAYFCIYV